MSTFSSQVEYPEKESLIDVSALMVAMAELDANGKLAPGQGAYAVIQKAIRLMNVTVQDPSIIDPVELANLYADLHRLADGFLAMKEIRE